MMGSSAMRFPVRMVLEVVDGEVFVVGDGGEIADKERTKMADSQV
jgi:hypothetical protein